MGGEARGDHCRVGSVRTLIVTSSTPNVSSGAGLRTFGVTAALARLEPVEVAYVVFGGPDPAPAFTSLPGVTLRAAVSSRGLARAIAFAHACARGVPHRIARGISRELERAVAGTPSEVRVIADGPTVAGALLPLARARPVVYLGHNVESAFRPSAHGRGLEQFERRVLRTYAEAWMATRADVTAAIALGAPPAATRLVPNVVDVASISAVRGAPRGHLLFVGDFTYAPNREGLAYLSGHILPEVWVRRPDVTLSVVGRGTTGVRTDARIEIQGFVESISALYERAPIVCVPLLHGGGSPLKFIEALAYGLPVVATPHAARLVEGGVPGEHFFVGSTPREFAESIDRLLGDPAEAARIGRAGRSLIESVYSIDALANVLRDRAA